LLDNAIAMNRFLRLSAAAALMVPVFLLASRGRTEAADGLSFVESVHDGARGVNGLKGAQSLALSADGTSVYVAGAGDSAVAVFHRDALSGTLSFVEEQRQATGGVQGLGGALAVVVSQDGANVYAAGSSDNSIVAFARDADTGALAYLETERNNVGNVVGIGHVNGLAMSPDGTSLYAASSQDNDVVVFGRDAGTGGLTFVEAKRDHVDGVQGLSGAQVVALSPDGAHVYVAGGSSLAVFTRDAATGMLGFVEVEQNGVGGVTGLAGATSLALSADGASLYVAGKGDDAVAAFSRDPATGKLTFVDTLQQGLDGVDGLDGVNALAVSPDGTHVYAVGSTPTSKTLTVLTRDVGSSELTLVGSRRDAVGDVTGLDGASAVAMSGDGAYVYTAAKTANAVSVFSTRCGDGILDAGEQCDDGNASDGDGCSGGCRLECATVTDCQDTDPCTETRCRSGECVFPRCGLGGSLCELTDGLKTDVPTLADSAECSPVSPDLLRAAKARLQAARFQLRIAKTQGLCVKKGKKGAPCTRSKTPSSKELKKLLKGVGTSVTGLETAASRLVKKQQITPECQSALNEMLGNLTTDLHTMVLHKGVCAP
jgi:cysteine-rich repeat protein